MGSPSVTSENRRRVALFVGAAAVVLASAAAAGVVLFRPAAPGPVDAVQAWLSAAAAGDSERLRLLSCAEVTDLAAFDAERRTSIDWAITDESADGGATATVTAAVTYTVEGYPQQDTWTFTVVREGEDWRFCGVAMQLTEPDTPRTSLAAWIAAAKTGDLAAVHAMTCPARAAEIVGEEVGSGERQSLTYEITDVRRLDETTAEVGFTVTVQRNGGPVSFDERWVFVDEDDGWKVCGPVVGQAVRPGLPRVLSGRDGRAAPGRG